MVKNEMFFFLFESVLRMKNVVLDYKVNEWNYQTMCFTYFNATFSCRNGTETVHHSRLQCPKLTLKMFVYCQLLLPDKG